MDRLYDVQLTNNACDPQSFQFEVFNQPTDIFVSPTFETRQVDVGVTTHVPLTVSSSPSIAPDDYSISLAAFAFSTTFESLSTSVVYSVAGTPFSNLFRNFNELGRRGQILETLVCPNEMLPPPPPETSPGGGFGGGGGPDGGGMGGFGGNGAGGAVGGFGGAGGTRGGFDGGATDTTMPR